MIALKPKVSFFTIRLMLLLFLLEMFVFIDIPAAGENKQKTLNLLDASSNNFPPMNVLDKDGKLTGFGCELSDAVIKAIGGNMAHIHSKHWVDVLEWPDSGKADFIHDAGYTEGRDTFLDYSDPVITMPEVIFVRHNQYDIFGFD